MTDLTNQKTIFRPYEIIIKCNMQGTDMHIHRFVTETTCRRITQAVLADEDYQCEYRETEK